MSKLKEQAIKLLYNIPEDKVITVIEILNAFLALYNKTEEPTENNEAAPCAMGVFSKYANPALIPFEKGAWSEAVKEKHDAN
jgi:hypothetical protein